MEKKAKKAKKHKKNFKTDGYSMIRLYVRNACECKMH